VAASRSQTSSIGQPLMFGGIPRKFESKQDSKAWNRRIYSKVSLLQRQISQARYLQVRLS